MTNKVGSIILIILLSILVFILGFIMYYGIKEGGFKNQKAELQLSESYEYDEVKNINISTRSSDIIIQDSDDDKVHVDVYATSNDEVSSDLNEGDLNVTSKNKLRICIICFRNSHQKVEVKLPKDFSGKINVSTKSGDVTLSNYSSANLKVEATSGDITVGSIKKAYIKVTSGDIEVKKAKNLEVKATSGDIELDEVEGKVNVKVTSGDIEIDSLILKDNSSIKATSGDVTIKQLDNAFVNTSVKSGDVKVNGSDRTAEFEINISVTSGDIRVN